jgi:hypothetical protein
METISTFLPTIFVSRALSRATLLCVLRNDPRRRVARMRDGDVMYELRRVPNGYIFRATPVEVYKQRKKRNRP